jgi:ubiquitin-like modifier-activating enzyme ATG7
MKDQTLDQQCTVTRPGVAAIASALAVELLVSILQHPKQPHAPAPIPVTNGSLPEYDRDPPEHPLGIVPHQIRGFLHTFQNMLINGKSYPQCSACSDSILTEYQADRWAFLKQALEDCTFVAELSGLAEVQRKAEQAAADIDWSDDEAEGGDADGEEGVLVDLSPVDEKPRG